MAGEGIYRFLLRMPEELRSRLNDAASGTGRSLNKEIVDRLEQSFREQSLAVAPEAAPSRINGEGYMHRIKSRRTILVLAALVAALAAAVGGLISSGRTHAASRTQIQIAQKQIQRESQGTENGGPGGESNDYLTAQKQFAEARTAPSGLVDPGAYGAAVTALNTLAPVGGAWDNVTAVKYDADHPAYRDFFSNSSGGSGLVTGRITGLAADDHGHVYAAGADGGVWRSVSGGGAWVSIGDSLPTLSSGDLEIAPDGALWYATGEANTGGTSYVGSGVYRLENPATGTFTPATRVGGTELESTTIGKLRFGGGKVWAATLRGVWSHSATSSSGTWTLSFAPNPQNLPASLKPFAQTPALAAAIGAGSSASDTNAPYKNIANDIAVDPKNPDHVIAAVAWRSGDAYNGFYETTNGGGTWVKVNPTGAIPANDIGYVTFAFAKDGSKLYAINQSPTLLNKLTGTVNSYLDGIYVSNSGSPAGPWSKVAESQKLANSGSALKQAVSGKGYGPGIQAWYNQFLAVDPSNANHVYAGLEEVYETSNGGSNWNTVGPYWNFYFSCWRPDVVYGNNGPVNGGCPLTTHSDQHSIAIGKDGNGKSWVYVGNDGGVYKRPLDGKVNGNGNATDWQSLNDGSIDALQYYAVGIGAINPAKHDVDGQTVDETKLPEVGAASGVLVSGGLQDNGGSLLNPDSGNMVSNFGGDGGDVLVDPKDGCNIVQEYVLLSMSLTQTCASPDPAKKPNAFLDLNQSTTFKIGPPDINARFIAPFVANTAANRGDEWLAGGNSLWIQDKGFAIRSGKGWGKPAYTLPNPAQTYTALAMNGDTAIGAWCGPCNNNGFARGLTVGTKTAGKWSFKPLAISSVASDKNYLPNRYIGGVAVDSNGVLYVALNGFSRRFTEGEGAGIGHVFRSSDSGQTWTSLDGTGSTAFPDVPANSIKVLSNGALVVGTDLGVVYRASGATAWNRLGTNLPLTVAMDVELGPDGKIYAATHGRGIWSITKP